MGEQNAVAQSMLRDASLDIRLEHTASIHLEPPGLSKLRLLRAERGNGVDEEQRPLLLRQPPRVDDQLFFFTWRA